MDMPGLEESLYMSCDRSEQRMDEWPTGAQCAKAPSPVPPTAPRTLIRYALIARGYDFKMMTLRNVRIVMVIICLFFLTGCAVARKCSGTMKSLIWHAIW